MIAPDGTDVAAAEAALEAARGQLPGGELPIELTRSGVTVRFGVQFGLYSVRTEEFDQLAAKVIERWARVPKATAA